MRNWIGILLTGVVTSMFYFPVTFTALPASNTKNILAALGVVLFVFLLVYRREFVISKDVLVLLLLATVVTALTNISVTVNHTPEFSYAIYTVTVSIWLAAAIVVCFMIRITHGRLDVPLILNYLIAACILQCIMALLIEYVPSFQSLVDSLFSQGQEKFHEAHRLYGIGASLDVAGSRFACVLAAIPALLYIDREKMSYPGMTLYVLSFVIITVVGNMIARTTTVGVLLGLGILGILVLRDIINGEPGRQGKLTGAWIVVLAVAIPVGIILYRSGGGIKDQLRYGFEGFFNLAETGQFQTQSSDIMLDRMVVFPENWKTWVIGDGYFMNANGDLNYLGDSTMLGYYMGTDIGYLRFIFLFGVPGLLAISLVMIYAAIIGARTFPRHRMVFYLALLAGFIIWIKVATDVFPFLVLGVAGGMVKDLVDYDSEEEEEEQPVS